jgi:hypothetical protein
MFKKFSCVFLMVLGSTAGFARAGDKPASLPAQLPEAKPAEASEAAPAPACQAPGCKEKCGKKNCGLAGRCGDRLHHLCAFLTYREEQQSCGCCCCKQCSMDCYPPLYVFFLDQCGGCAAQGCQGDKCSLRERCKSKLQGLAHQKAEATTSAESCPAEAAAPAECAVPSKIKLDLRKIFHKKSCEGDCSNCNSAATAAPVNGTMIVETPDESAPGKK